MNSTQRKNPVKWRLIGKRLRRHHLPLFLISTVAVFLMYRAVDSEDVIFRLSMATAYPALFLLSITLLTGPFKVLRNRPNPVSDDLTRDIGIWAAIVGFVHVIFGLQVHMRGRMWLLFVYEEMNFPFIRMDLFGTANHTGLIATIILGVLLATSNNRTLKALGVNSWKRIQRWNYGLYGFVLIHSVLYQVIEKRTPPYTYIFGAMGLIVILTQLAGFVKKRRQISREATS